jgi:hypothetical protein
LVGRLAARNGCGKAGGKRNFANVRSDGVESEISN